MLVIPFLLDDVGVAVPLDVGTVGADVTKCPGTLITNFIPLSIVPGGEQRIGYRFDLLVRGNADLAIRIDITVGACAAGDTTAIQQRTGVRHSSVDGIGAKEIVIGTEELKAARLTVDTDVLSPGCEDKEYMIYR